MSDKESASSSESFDKEGFIALFLNPQVPFNYKAMLVMGVGLYTVFPLEFVPDILGPLGFADDAGIAIVAAKVFTHFANKALESRHTAQQAPVIEGQATPAEPMNVQAQAAPPPSAPNPAQAHTPPPAPTYPQNALHDEAHEQLIARKHAESDDDFERMMRERGGQTPSNWDPSRHNPFDNSSNRGR